jgi:nitrogen fixation protein NifU and related proteins
VIDDLYQEVILDHGKRPRNFGKLENASLKAEGFNPLCGDRLTLELKLDNGIVKDAKFTGAGCAISVASASLMTETLKGKSVDQVNQVFERFHQLLTTDASVPDMGKLAVFSGVREFPARVKCATLAWHTMKAALENPEQKVSTE